VKNVQRINTNVYLAVSNKNFFFKITQRENWFVLQNRIYMSAKMFQVENGNSLETRLRTWLAVKLVGNNRLVL
jgi:hypothetical protein